MLSCLSGHLCNLRIANEKLSLAPLQIASFLGYLDSFGTSFLFYVVLLFIHATLALLSDSSINNIELEMSVLLEGITYSALAGSAGLRAGNYLTKIFPLRTSFHYSFMNPENLSFDYLLLGNGRTPSAHVL